MSLLQFKYEHGETPFGIFHPTGYIISAFADESAARAAADALLQANFEPDYVHTLSGDQVRQAISQAHPPQGLIERLKQNLASTLGTEAYHWEQDLELAEQGAGFVTVYCGDGDTAHAAASVLREHDPHALRRYRQFAIEDLLQSQVPPRG